MARRRNDLAARRRRCVAGPWDGGLATATADAFGWIDHTGGVHPAPCRDEQGRPDGTRVPYFNVDDAWEFRGIGYFNCTGCNALIGPALGGGDRDCPLCGEMNS